ncbi:FtsX-like permease family protein [Actinomadura napierensis]|uniref:FtsX-like permease family protein n=1 Tax=Actinomadura napierensis TaxID=267854 RepID=A0ABP5M2H9_9ACTN
MFSLALTTLRARKAGFAGAFVALFFAAALVAACGTLLETGLRGGIPPERYAGTPVIVAGDQDAHAVEHKKGKEKRKSKPLAEHVWIPSGIADRLRSVEGVRSVVPEVTFPAYVVAHGRTLTGPDGSASWGHDWSSAALTPFTLREGRAPSGPGDVVIDSGLARRGGLRPGDEVGVRSAAAPTTYRVTGIAAASAGPLERQAAVFFSPAEAVRLAGRPGQVAAVGLLPAEGTGAATVAERASKAVAGTGAKVYTGDGRGPLEFLDAAKARVMLISLSGTLGATSLLVAVLVVVGTFGLSIQQRYREIALLRAVAATPRQVRALIGREALVVGLVAGAAGSIASVAVAQWLRAGFVDAGAIPDVLQPSYGPLPMLAAIAATTLAAWSAARISARRIAQIRPTEALGEAAVEPPRPGPARLVAGLAFLVGAVAVTIVLGGLSTEPAAVPVTFVSALLWVTAVSLLGPVIAAVAARVLDGPLNALSPVGGHLAAANVRAGSRRLASVIAPLCLAVTMTCTILFAQTTLGHAAEREKQEGIAAQYVLASNAPGVPTAAAGAARKVKGVETVTEIVETNARGLGLGKYTVQGVTPQGLTRTMDLGATSGSLDRLGPGTVALSTNGASRAHAKVGDRLRLRLGDGTPISPTVVAVYSLQLGFPDVTLPRDVVAPHVDAPLDTSVLVRTAPGAHGVERALADAVRGYPGVHVADRQEVRAQQAAQQRANRQVQYLAMGLIIAFAAIAVVNTLVMASADRSREFALLRLIGTTRRQVVRMTRWESAVLVLVAGVLGSVLSFVVLSAFTTGMTRYGTPHIPPPAYLAVLAIAAATAFVATEGAVRIALRGHPADTVNARE